MWLGWSGIRVAGLYLYIHNLMYVHLCLEDVIFAVLSFSTTEAENLGRQLHYSKLQHSALGMWGGPVSK